MPFPLILFRPTSEIIILTNLNLHYPGAFTKAILVHCIVFKDVLWIFHCKKVSKIMILTNVNLHKSGLLSIIKRSSRSVASGLQKFRSSVLCFFFRTGSYRPTVITELAAFKLINFYDFKDIFLWKKSTLVVAIPYPWGYPTALDGIKWVNKDVN